MYNASPPLTLFRTIQRGRFRGDPFMPLEVENALLCLNSRLIGGGDATVPRIVA